MFLRFFVGLNNPYLILPEVPIIKQEIIMEENLSLIRLLCCGPGGN